MPENRRISGRSLWTVLLVCAALGLCAAVAYRSMVRVRSPGVPDTARQASSGEQAASAEPESVPGSGYRPLPETMEAFFRDNPAPIQPAPPLEALAGRWTVDADSSQLLAGPSGEPLGSAGIPFSFRIAAEGGAYQLRWEGQDRPVRKLSLKENRIVAQGADGNPDLILDLAGGRLLGTMKTEKPIQGRLEFHATRRK